MAMRGRPCGRRRLTRPAKLRKRIISPPRHGGKASVWRDRSAIPRAPRALFRFGNVGSFCQTPHAGASEPVAGPRPNAALLFVVIFIVFHCYLRGLGRRANRTRPRGARRNSPLRATPHCYFIVINNGRPVHLLPPSRCQTARSALAAVRRPCTRHAGPSALLIASGRPFRIANLLYHNHVT